jgi:hypothetical protein
VNRIQKLGASHNGAVIKSLTIEEAANAVRELIDEDMVQIAETVAKAVRDAILDDVHERIGFALQPLIVRARKFSEDVEARANARMQQMENDFQNIKGEFQGQIEELKTAIAEKFSQVDHDHELLSAQLRAEIANGDAAAVRDLSGIIDSLPTPEITIPADAIQVQVEVTEPPQSPKTVTKEIQYDPTTGRPCKIVETDQ